MTETGKTIGTGVARVLCSAACPLMTVLFFLCAGPALATESTPLALPDVSFSWKGYFKALAILCFLLCAFFSALWLLRRFSRGGMRLMGGGPELRVESRVALGPRKWVMVVRYMDKRLLLGVTDTKITLLTETPIESEEEHADSVQP